MTIEDDRGRAGDRSRQPGGTTGEFPGRSLGRDECRAGLVFRGQAQPALLLDGDRGGRRHGRAAMVTSRRSGTPGTVAGRDERALKGERYRNGGFTASGNWRIDRLGLGQRHGPTG
jgi:hypothetical protein